MGALGQVGVLAGMFAYSRDHERDADRIGAILMHKSGYDVSEAGKVGHSAPETKARPDGAEQSVLFVTHPGSENASPRWGSCKTYSGGEANQKAWQNMSAPFLREWLAEYGSPSRAARRASRYHSSHDRGCMTQRVPAASAEVYRLRATEGDLELSISGLQSGGSSWRRARRNPS